ncbi:hypothetical protein D9758_017945 [Tetrapyrgos nigripes]|uniref:FAD-binding PCMH-type domain-containing protein n=1 Tax=Tetrapyrgos nigripes TaxID=182062 RepID=A0A8H5BSR8_9AGAR|nr:hypothetical protein D9758_017945 [Tetrapyrgos nigripes]
MAALPPFPDQFKGDFVTTDHPDYAEAIFRWGKTAERNAKVVAFVKDSEDVVLALSYARKARLPIAIRGGGHSPAGASSTDGGLVIDLSRHIHYSRVDPDKKLAYVGGGALWRDVDKTAIEHGLATVGGTVNHTGVGGLTVGGGYGYLSGLYGMAVDNLATVVTADGSILTANDKENPDLFWAIRGGGSNFGVVTEFVFKLYPQRRTVFAGKLIFPGLALKAIVETTETWRKNISPLSGMIQFFAVGPHGEPVVVASVFYNGSEAEGRECYKPFYDLGPIADHTSEIPYEQLNAMENERTQHGSCIYQKGIAQRTLDYPSLQQAFDKVVELTSPENDFSLVLVFEYFNLDKINSIPTEATAFRRDQSATILVNFVWNENTPENLQRARKGAGELVNIIGSAQTKYGTTKVEMLGYTNYDPEGVTGSNEANPDKALLAFGNNYSRLQQIKKKYDPDQVFNKWFPIKPAP